MRIAHFSDLHLLSLEGSGPMRFLNKRLTGLAMLRMHRKTAHKPFAVRAVADEVKRANVDHVVVTGDLTNLALESEFDLVRRFFEEDLGLPATDVSVIPGNHDVYTRGSARKGRFLEYLGPYMTTDLPAFGVEHFGARYPFVRLRPGVAIIGMSTAVPRGPLMAAGHFGEAQIDELKKILVHPEVKARGTVLLQHHPAHNLKNRAVAYLEGLHDSRNMLKTLALLEHGSILHGHSHVRVRREVQTQRGKLDVFCATSASLLSGNPHRHAGFNVYDIEEGSGRIRHAEAHVLEATQHDHALTFRQGEIPVDSSNLRHLEHTNHP